MISVEEYRQKFEQVIDVPPRVTCDSWLDENNLDHLPKDLTAELAWNAAVLSERERSVEICRRLATFFENTPMACDAFKMAASLMEAGAEDHSSPEPAPRVERYKPGRYWRRIW